MSGDPDQAVARFVTGLKRKKGHPKKKKLNNLYLENDGWKPFSFFLLVLQTVAHWQKRQRVMKRLTISILRLPFLLYKSLVQKRTQRYFISFGSHLYNGLQTSVENRRGKRDLRRVEKAKERSARQGQKVIRPSFKSWKPSSSLSFFLSLSLHHHGPLQNPLITWLPCFASFTVSGSCLQRNKRRRGCYYGKARIVSTS